MSKWQSAKNAMNTVLGRGGQSGFSPVQQWGRSVYLTANQKETQEALSKLLDEWDRLQALSVEVDYTGTAMEVNEQGKKIGTPVTKADVVKRHRLLVRKIYHGFFQISGKYFRAMDSGYGKKKTNYMANLMSDHLFDERLYSIQDEVDGCSYTTDRIELMEKGFMMFLASSSSKDDLEGNRVYIVPEVTMGDSRYGGPDDRNKPTREEQG